MILAGQKTFGLAVYEMLLEEGHEIAAVWAPPGDKLDDRAWRDHRSTPRGHRTAGLVHQLGSSGNPPQQIDLFVAAHSHDFIGRQSRAATRLGGIGYHPSLLPVHRGRDAVEWTIRMGDRVAGGSVYWLTDAVDGGPIFKQEHCFVQPSDDASSLWRRELFPLGVRLLRAAMRNLENGILIEEPQDEACATWEPSIGRPPLYRPELPQLGSVEGMTVMKAKGVSRL